MHTFHITGNPQPAERNVWQYALQVRIRIHPHRNKCWKHETASFLLGADMYTNILNQLKNNQAKEGYKTIKHTLSLQITKWS